MIIPQPKPTLAINNKLKDLWSQYKIKDSQHLVQMYSGIKKEGCPITYPEFIMHEYSGCLVFWKSIFRTSSDWLIFTLKCSISNIKTNP